MAQMTFTVPDEIGQRIVDGFAVKHGYEPTVDDGQGGQAPNPQSKFDFMGDAVATWIRDSVIDAEVAQAIQQVRADTREAGERDILIEVSR